MSNRTPLRPTRGRGRPRRTRDDTDDLQSPSRNRNVRPRRSTRNSSLIESWGSLRRQQAPQVITPNTDGTTSIRERARQAYRGDNLQLGNSYDITNLDRQRICYCDQVKRKDLTREENTIINCCNDECENKFHLGCIKQFDEQFYRNNDDNSMNYFCMPCKESTANEQQNTRWEGATNLEKFRRMGMADDETLSQTQNAIRQRVRTMWRILHKNLEDSNVPDDLIRDIKNNCPRDYPLIANMKPEMREKHSRVGRLFETSMLLFQIQQCDCCGEIRPVHNSKTDARIKDDNLLYKRKHLNQSYFEAIKCNCMQICRGEQYYACSRPKEMAHFHLTHSFDARLRQQLKEGPKVLICTRCHKEMIGNVEEKLRLGRTFSRRNGFGRREFIPIPVHLQNDVNFHIARELELLLKDFTIVEEAAIRQITPLISMLRLKGGNIGSKGNISCVWQKSRLATVLPNLPSEVKYIVILRSNNNATSRNRTNTTQLASTKFERRKIGRALELLALTVPGVWKPDASFEFTFSHDRLNQWPENGHLETIPGIPRVAEVEHRHSLSTNTNEAGETDEYENNNRVVDGGDQGPANMQNAVDENESYEVVVNAEGTSTVLPHSAQVGRENMADLVAQLAARGREGEGANRTESGGGNRESVTFRDTDVLHVDGFADMGKTRYAWARAFPTLFIPEYVKVGTLPNGEESWEWTIFDDITGFRPARDKSVVPVQWMEHMMWRNDGRPAAHPTFGLTLLNYKMRTQLHKQGLQVINTSDIDLQTTLDVIRTSHEGGDGGELQRQCDKLIEKTTTFAANVVATQPYWRSKYHEFRAINFFNGYVKECVPTVFHTGSLAEHHEFPLRLLLQSYAGKVGDDDIAANNGILENDNKFSRAVQKYKHVASQYLAVKMELFSGIVMKEIHDILEADTSFEFAKSRGIIHYHSSMHGKVTATTKRLMACLMKYAIALSMSLDHLDAFISENWQNSAELRSTYQENPVTCEDNREALKLREAICNDIGGGENAFGKTRWETFVKDMATNENEASESIGEIMEEEWGYTAMHHGKMPQQWVRPGGARTEDGYRQTSPNMMKTEDVMNLKELKKTKVQSEKNLLNRRVNISNHCGTHKCSDYCLVSATRDRIVKLAAEKAGYLATVAVGTTVEEGSGEPGKDGRKGGEKWIRANGDVVIRELFKKCRMYFGEALVYDTSGEHNLTGGMILQLKPKLVFDRNGLPRYNARRNHPRIIAGPQSNLYYGANTDCQRLLVGGDEKEIRRILDNDHEKFIKYNKNLHILGRPGLERMNAIKILERYLTSYQCKGGESSDDWKKSQQALTREYCRMDGNADRNLRSLVAKQMCEISGGTSFSRDQAAFQLSGGVLTMSTSENILKCTVNSVRADTLVENNANSFQWNNVLRKYKRRSAELETENLYRFIAWYWPSGTERSTKPKVPQIFGYHDKASWPLKEEYAKMMITLYVPWRQDPDEHKINTDNQETRSYKEALLELMWNDAFFPQQVRADILFQRVNGRNIVAAEGAVLRGGSAEPNTPTRERVDEHLADALLENEQLPTLQRAEGSEWEGFQENEFNSIPTNDENVDWSIGYEERCENWLKTLTTDFYKERDRQILENSEDDNDIIKLFDPDVYRPENVRGDEQDLIVHHSLYGHYMYERYENIVRDNRDAAIKPPPSHMCFVEGKPGTGKTFITKTLRNITRVVRKNNKADQGSAPTGCAADLLGGSTHYRELKIPVGKKFRAAPNHITGGNSNELIARKKHLCSCHMRLMDEHSMSGRAMFGWIRYRHEELRRPVTMMDDAGNEIENEEATYGLSKDIYERSWGGVPQVYSLGDTAQLPPVMQKTLYDESAAEPGTSDALGKTTIAEMLLPPDENEMRSYVFVMENVLRQDDPEFLNLLKHMTNGTVGVDEVPYMRRRCLDQLPPGEQTRFRTNTLHLCTTWKEANPITVEYLQQIGKPVAKVRAKIEGGGSRTNHMLKESSCPILMAFCENAKVMLLENFIVEYGLANGSVGTIKSIVYKEKDGARNDDKILPAYIVVDFPNSKIPEEDKCWDDKPATWVPIPVSEYRCEKKCCSMTMIYLRICVAITVHKAQGMTVGEGEQFENVLIHISEVNKTAGLDLVAWSRAKTIQNVAIHNNSMDLPTERLYAIGTTKQDDKRREFVQNMKEKAVLTKAEIHNNISNLDPENNGSFDRGKQFLRNWYNDKLADVRIATT